MPLIDIFKKEKGKKKPVVEPSPTAKKAPVIKTETGEEKKTAKKTVGRSGSYRILNVPHITEKATDLSEKGQYIFRVFPEANKSEVKKAIEKDFGVNVVSVRIVNVKNKKKRLGRIEGVKPGYKKAIVKVKKGQKIEVLPR